MKTLQSIFFYLLFISGAFTSLQAQILDYSTVNYSTSLCNVFNASPLKVVNTLKHHPVSGGVSYNGTALVLQTKGGTSLSTTLGTAFAIEVAIKQNYKYSITVNASKSSQDPVSDPTLEIGAVSTLPNPNNTSPTTCGSIDQNKWSILQPTKIGSVFINSTSSSNYNIIQNYTPNSVLSFFTILAHSGSQTQASNVIINSITITETPLVTFTLSPSSVTIPCNSTTPRTFTVTNVYNTPGTLSYDWNLGTASNGWLYNGSAAPQTFTTSTNSITLTPGSGTPSNVKVTVKLNGTAQPQLTSTVTTSSNPGLSLSINAPSPVCASGVFSVNNLPAGATVSWSAYPANNVYISPNGNNATISNSVSPGGSDVNITATVTLSPGCQQSVTGSYYFGQRPTTGTYVVDNGYIPVTAQNTNFVLPDKTITLTLNNIGANGSFTIQKVYGNAITYGSGNTVSFQLGNFSQSIPGQGTITLVSTVSTTCGSVSQTYTFTTQNQCGSCMGSYSVSPNPAPGNVRIKAKDVGNKTGSSQKKSIYKISVYNQFGTLLKVQSYGGVQEATLDVSGLKNGTYVLKINNEEADYTEQLIIAK